MIRTSIYTILLSLFISNILFSQATISLVQVPAEVFVNKGKTSFDSILFVNDDIRSKVKVLFDNKELNHEFTLDSSKFSKYWDIFGNQWYWIKLKPNESPFLLFKGISSFMDEKEYVELFDVKKKSENRIFSSAGNLLAYKVHPFTKEIVLYVHKYPCCQSASHNLIRVRYSNGEIRTKDRFFVGRDDGDMVGPFFPDKVKQPRTYEKLNARTTLRWSPAIVNNNAFIGRAKSNVMIHYTKGSVYKVLHETGEGWQFVVMFSGIAHEQSSVLNYTNFINRPVYGWIKKD